VEKKITLTLNIEDAGTVFASVASTKDTLERHLKEALRIGYHEYANLLRSHIKRADNIMTGLMSGGGYESESFDIVQVSQSEALQGLQMHEEFIKRTEKENDDSSGEEVEGSDDDDTPPKPDNVTNLFK